MKQDESVRSKGSHKRNITGHLQQKKNDLHQNISAAAAPAFISNVSFCSFRFSPPS
jgi:hypothetical protein